VNVCRSFISECTAIVKELTTLRKNSSSAGVKSLASFAAASGDELTYKHHVNVM